MFASTSSYIDLKTRGFRGVNLNPNNGGSSDSLEKIQKKKKTPETFCDTSEVGKNARKKSTPVIPDATVDLDLDYPDKHDLGDRGDGLDDLDERDATESAEDGEELPEDNSDVNEEERAKRQARAMLRSKDKKSVLDALLPGAEIKDAGSKVRVSTSTTRETVVFNIGGTLFETYRSTLHSIPHSPLANDSFLQKHFREDKGQYFFDRDPDVFGAILNYLRSGELHLPTKYCGPAVKNELEYWGIEEEEIEECCWTNYSAWTSTLEALRKLERDRKVQMPGQEHFRSQGQAPSTLREIQMRGWEVLNSPQSGLLAKVYSYVSLTFVLVSIFSFVAQTHEAFRVPVTSDGDLDPVPLTLNLSDFGNSSVANDSLISNVTGSYGVRNTALSRGGLNSINSTNSTSGQERSDDVHPVLLYVDAACLVFFLSEFVLRFILSPRKCKLLMLPMTVFELLALLPDLIEFGIRIFQPGRAGLSAVDVITFLRLLRVFRIFRLMRHFPGLWILFYTLKASVKELLLLLMFLCVGMLLFASLIYYADDRDTFTSIPMACWWSVITMTTVGYGDMYPTTKWGYVVGSLTAICGVLVIGFTVPVLVNNFILYYQHTQCAINREDAKKRRAETKRGVLEHKEKAQSHEKANPNLIKMQQLRKLYNPGSADTVKGLSGHSKNGTRKGDGNDFNSNTRVRNYQRESDGQEMELFLSGKDQSKV